MVDASLIKGFQRVGGAFMLGSACVYLVLAVAAAAHGDWETVLWPCAFAPVALVFGLELWRGWDLPEVPVAHGLGPLVAAVLVLQVVLVPVGLALGNWMAVASALVFTVIFGLTLRDLRRAGVRGRPG